MSRTVIKNVKLIDGIKNSILDNATVVVEDKNIEFIGTSYKTKEVDTVVDGNNMTLMPGLIDCHVHLDIGEELDFPGIAVYEPFPMSVIRSTERLSRYLPSGFTSIRFNGGYEYLGTSLRDAVNMGIIKGPRVVAAGKYLSITGGHGQFFKPWVKLDHSMVDMVDGADEIRKAIRAQIGNGVDVIKFFSTGGVTDSGSNPNSQEFTDEELEVIISEAKKGGKRTSTHAHGTGGIKSAVKAGVDSIEHGSILDEECIELMKQKGTFLVPTLSASYWIIKKGKEIGLPDFIMEKTKNIVEKIKNSFNNAYKEGINIAMGTDSGTPFNAHGNNALELKLMVDYGMKPMDAIKCATIKSAENLGINNITGSIEVGKMADMILIDGNPIDDISILQNKDKIKIVMKEGNIEVKRQ